MVEKEKSKMNPSGDDPRFHHHPHQEIDARVVISKQHPWKKANLFSRLFFWWVTPIIRLGNQRALRVRDLHKVLREDESEELGNTLEKKWLKQVDANKCQETKQKKPNFARVLLSLFGSDYIIPGVQMFVDECVVKIGAPLCLSQLIKYFNHDNVIPVEHAYLYATGVVLGSMFTAFNNHIMCFTCQRIGMRIRVSTCSLIFRKSLRLSQKSLCETDIGQMINLISNDVNRFDLLFVYFNYIWVGPMAMIVLTLVLYFHIGLASLIGLIVMFLTIILQRPLGTIFSRLRQEVALRSDERIKIINEIIPAMRVIKMYAWETPFEKLTRLYRKLEMTVIRRTSYIRAFNLTLAFVAPKLMIFPTLVVFVLLGNELTPDKVFLIVALFNNIRVAMPADFVSAIQMAAETWVSIKRIENFLLLEEMETTVSQNVANARKSQLTSQQNPTVELRNVSVKWPVASVDQEENTLTDVSLTVRTGQLLTIVGQIGSGKSTLLNVILGELVPLQGSCIAEGRVAFCSQEPWIITGSIKQNILCGKEMNPERYYRVIRSAALEKDFEQLPQGDSSIIGEGGVSLSGGQKARINLARCLYVDADIYLLDDPLSAVDSHVQSHLFQKAIIKFLHGKIRILVTHHPQYLRDMDKIISLNSGRVEFSGTYRDFQRVGLNWAELITKYDEIEDDEVFDDDQQQTKSVHLSTISECDENFATWSEEKETSNSSSLRKKVILKHARRQSQRNIYRKTASISNSQKIRSIRESNKSKARRSIMIDCVDDSSVSQDDSSRGVSAVTYWKYFRSGAGAISFSFFILNCIIAEFLFCASDYWLNLWTEAESQRSPFLTNTTLSSIITKDKEETNNKNDFILLDRNMGIYVYSALIGGVFFFGYLRSAHFYGISTAASVKLHDNMFHAILRAPISFFDQNPVGRIVNRFSKDTGSMDDQLPTFLFDSLWIALNTLGAFVTVAIVKYWLIFPAIVFGVLFFFIRRGFLKASCGIKRLEATTKSPVFTQLYSAVIGLTTLRAHHCQSFFQRDFDRYQDVHSSAWFFFMASSRWLGVYMDCIVVTYIASITYACVLLGESLNSSEAGLIIAAAMNISQFQFGVRQSAEMENQMTSVDRIIEYGKLSPEAPLQSSKNFKPPTTWPSSGVVELNDLSLRYSSTDPPVLKNLHCTISSKEKIGIVGRSGAGKSTIIAALFRLTEPQGKILIDGIDVKDIGLHDLRSKISIIPQEPTLFSGSLRFNLDPFGIISDDVLWSAIKEVHLDKFMIVELESTVSQSLLDFEVSEGGSNLSVGERQLICLARVILRNNRILVLDEATASVDKETDTFIQLIIRDKFQNCTVLTIAHRLNTIMDSNKIMVLDAGQLSEFDEPIRLLSNPSGIFHSLVEQNGPEVKKELVDIAQKAYNSRNSIGCYTIPKSLDNTDGVENNSDEADTISATDMQ